VGRPSAEVRELERALTMESIAYKGKLLSTGSTTLNLACSGDLRGGFMTGHYYFFVGDSNSGKTFLGLTCLAEAAANPAFDDHRLIYDAVEGGALMDFERFFGKRMASRIEPPRVVDGQPVFSRTVEEMYDHLDDAYKDGRPFIYIEDSQDALSSEAEIKKSEQLKRGRRKEKKSDDEEPTGSFGDGKAKVHSANIRRQMGRLEERDSILLILNQTRDSFSMFEKSSYSGGKALKFYATLQLWSKVAGQITKTVRGRPRQLGINAKVQVKKNRMTGRDRSVVVPIYHSVGIDDIGGCIDYLLAEKAWSKRGQTIVAKNIGPVIEGSREKLVHEIERRDLEEDIRELVGEVWAEIEEACEVERKPRYE